MLLPGGGGYVGWLIYTMITKLVSFLKRYLLNEKIALINELLFIYIFSLLGPEIEEFCSILIIKQYFAECVFVLAPRLV